MVKLLHASNCFNCGRSFNPMVDKLNTHQAVKDQFTPKKVRTRSKNLKHLSPSPTPTPFIFSMADFIHHHSPAPPQALSAGVIFALHS
jgi:hypothetical protein